MYLFVCGKKLYNLDWYYRFEVIPGKPGWDVCGSRQGSWDVLAHFVEKETAYVMLARLFDELGSGQSSMKVDKAGIGA